MAPSLDLPLETKAFLGMLVPVNCDLVLNNPVKDTHQVFDMTIRGYRDPYPGEIGLPLSKFLSVIRVSR